MNYWEDQTSKYTNNVLEIYNNIIKGLLILQIST